KDDGNPAVKQVTLTLLATGGEGDAVDFAWTLEEAGRGSWLSLHPFGLLTPDPAKLDDGQHGPALLYERADGKSVVPLPALLVAAPVALEKGATWSGNHLAYKVTGDWPPVAGGEENRGPPATWEIDVRSPYGRKR